MYRLPAWVNEVLKSNKTMEYLAGVFFEASSHSEEMKKLKVGYLLKEMLEHFQAKISSTLTPDRSLFIYSAHDTTIANFLNGLNVYDVRCSSQWIQNILFINFLVFFRCQFHHMHPAYILNCTNEDQSTMCSYFIEKMDSKIF